MPRSERPTQLIALRIPKDLLADGDKLAAEAELDRSAWIRSLIRWGVDHGWTGPVPNGAEPAAAALPEPLAAAPERPQRPRQKADKSAAAGELHDLACFHPRDQERRQSYGTWCGACGVRLR
jgi:hypothetical protein